MTEKQGTIAAAVLLLVACLACQIMAVQFLMGAKDVEISPKTEPPSQGQIRKTPSRIETSTPPERTPKEDVAQKRTLRKLETQEEFLAFTSKEVELLEIFRAGGGYIDSTVGVDMDAPDLLKQVEKLREKRMGWMQEAKDITLKYLDKEDFSHLSDEEYERLSSYFEDKLYWIDHAYDDSLEPSVKLELMKKWYDRLQEAANLVRINYEAAHGAVFEAYEHAYENAGACTPTQTAGGLTELPFHIGMKTAKCTTCG